MNKHPDDYVFGLDKGIQDKMKAKFCPVKEQEVKVWIEEVTGTAFTTPDDFQRSLMNGIHLLNLMNTLTKELRRIQNENYAAGFWDESKKKWKDGAFAVHGDADIKKQHKWLPSTCKDVWRTSTTDGRLKTLKINKPVGGKAVTPFKARENITRYVNACKSLGMLETDCFVSTDLWGGKNVMKVIDQIQILGAYCQQPKMYWGGSTIGKQIAKETKRTFSKETLAKGRAIVPLQSAGSIAVEKSKGTDHIVKYGKAGTELGKSVGGVSQQNAGSIAVAKETGTDAIVRYALAGQDMGKSVGGVSQQNAGSIEVAKGKGTDAIVKYGFVGQEMGKSVGGVSQQNAGSIEVKKEGKVDSIVSYGLLAPGMGDSVGGTSQQTEGCVATDKGSKLDAVSRALN